MAKRLLLDGREGGRIAWPREDLLVAACGEGGILFCRYPGTMEGFSIGLTVAQWQSLVERVKLEDVPESKSPGQRLFEETYGQVWDLVAPEHRQPWEDRAQRLGIQPL